jgi:hypothetical protein
MQKGLSIRNGHGATNAGSYQWQRNNVNIPGTTSSRYNVLGWVFFFPLNTIYTPFHNAMNSVRNPTNPPSPARTPGKIGEPEDFPSQRTDIETFHLA